MASSLPLALPEETPGSHSARQSTYMQYYRGLCPDTGCSSLTYRDHVFCDIDESHRISFNIFQGRIQGGFEGFVRTPPGWWVILHHHATCGQTSKRIVFPASATSYNLQFCPRLLFTQALSRQQADWCQPGIGPSGWTSCSRGLSAVNRRIQNYSPVVRRPWLRIAWKTWSLFGEGGSLILKLLDHLIQSLV